MSKIVSVSLDALDTNPHRRLGDYPYVEKKLAALVHSINDVGLWEGVIGRKNGNRYEIAFGHHRVEAARRAGLKKLPLIVRDLDDEGMLKFMGRENGEDYNAEFLTLLETWEAAEDWICQAKSEAEPLDIARLLGWTRIQTSEKRATIGVMTEQARACCDASKLIKGGRVDRGDLRDHTVKTARDLLGALVSRLDLIDRVAVANKLPATQVTKLKDVAVSGMRATLDDVREGTIPKKDAVGYADSRFLADKETTSAPPMFYAALDIMAKQLGKMLKDDSLSLKLAEIIGVFKDVNALPNAAAKASLRDVKSGLLGVSKRAEDYHDDLAKASVADTVTTLKEVK